MKYCEELFAHIAKGERKKAIVFLDSLKKKTSCKAYGEAREKILIVETAGIFNERIPLGFVDENALAEDLFEDRLSAVEAVERLCTSFLECACQNRHNAFKKALSYIDKNFLSCQLTVSDVAQYSGRSQSDLVKLFKENAGVTPGDYIGKKRIEESISYLRKNTSVEKSAILVGFSSVETYIRTFKKHMGMTPGMWKKKYL